MLLISRNVRPGVRECAWRYVILPRMRRQRPRHDRRQEWRILLCPLDQHFLTFAGINAEALKAELAAGKGDGEVVDWINAHSTTQPSPIEIAAWSAYQDQRGPADLESRQFFHECHTKLAPKRQDIATWFDLLDLDDFASFGGQV